MNILRLGHDLLSETVTPEKVVHYLRRNVHIKSGASVVGAGSEQFKESACI